MLFVMGSALLMSTAPSAAETRSLKLYFLHTGERETITFKRNGKYVQSGLRKINRFLRDWRRNEPTKMDPRLLDLVWEIYQETGSKNAIHVISAYRSPATNSLLRKRGRGVATKSQHTLGKALDFFIPGVPLRKLRNIGLKKGLGGVGYYPKSGSPFVHMDTGRVRHWPRMSRKELVRVFPRGKTLHVPTDGKPLARYNQAKAAYERKISGRDRIVVAKAEEIERAPRTFARSLGRGDEDEGATGIVSAPRPVAVQRQPAPTPAPAATISGTPSLPSNATSPGLAAPTPVEGLTPAPVVETPQTILASLPPSALPIPLIAPRTIAAAAITNEAEDLQPEAIAENEIETTEEDSLALALIVPTPADRQPIAATQIEEQLASVEPTALAPANSDRIGTGQVFSPSEIADLRQQVYATLKAEHQNKPAQTDGDTQAPDQTRIEVASLEPTAAQGETIGQRLVSGIVVPQPNPRSDGAIALETQTAREPLEPGARTTGTLAIPGLSPVPEPETAIAQLEPLEPGVTSTNGVSIPSPNPTAQVEEAVPSETVTVAGTPIPSPALRTTGEAEQATQAPVQVASGPAARPEGSELSLEQFQTANLDQRLIGKWALAADTSIKDIADIRPPAYGRNMIRELPQSVLSSGFSQTNLSSFTQGFSGSSLEFLDFKRFQ